MFRKTLFALSAIAVIAAAALAPTAASAGWKGGFKHHGWGHGYGHSYGYYAVLRLRQLRLRLLDQEVDRHPVWSASEAHLRLLLRQSDVRPFRPTKAPVSRNARPGPFHVKTALTGQIS